MVDPRTARLWSFRTLYAGLAVLIILFGLLPLSAAPDGWPLPDAVVQMMPDWLHPHDWPGTDLLLVLTLVWVLRRPDYVPVMMIAAVFLLDDLVAYRPPGLWTAIVLVATEFLRARESGTRDLPFWGEWAMVAAVMLAMVAVNRLVLAIFMVPQVALGLDLILLAMNVLPYPLAATAVNLALGLYRAAPGEVDSWGRRL